MRIQQIVIPVTDVEAAAAWFAEVLQLPVEGATVTIGWSRIVLQAATQPGDGVVHLAFNVPDNRFAAAEAWLRQRVPLQRNAEGDDYFALPGNWLSQSIYFAGPDAMILELIGRRRLPASSATGPFHGDELTCVSEVGLPSDDVVALEHQIAQQFGLAPLSPSSPHFAPLGDDEGLLIAVASDRCWFPEQRQLPSARGLEVTLTDVPDAASMKDAAQGWQLRSA